MWTLVGALLIFGERLNVWQWIGVTLAIGSILAFSISQHKSKSDHPQSAIYNKYYICLALAILIGACSGLYDKYMMRQFDHNAVQVYYTFYQAVMMLCVWMIVNQKNLQSKISNIKSIKKFWASILISLFLIVSDNVYMLALQDPDSMIAVVSTIRRGGTVIGFAYGLIYLKEQDPWKKILSMIGVLAGLLCLAIGTF
jgi:transporter family protein